MAPPEIIYEEGELVFAEFGMHGHIKSAKFPAIITGIRGAKSDLVYLDDNKKDQKASKSLVLYRENYLEDEELALKVCHSANYSIGLKMAEFWNKFERETRLKVFNRLYNNSKENLTPTEVLIENAARELRENDDEKVALTTKKNIEKRVTKFQKDLASELSAYFDDQENEVAEMQVELDEANNEIINLKELADIRDAHNTELKSEVKKLKREVTKLKNDVAVSKTSCAATRDAEKKKFNEDKKKLSDERNKLSDEKNKLSDEKNKLNAEILSLKAQVEAEAKNSRNARAQAHSLLNSNNDLMKDNVQLRKQLIGGRSQDDLNLTKQG